MKKKLTYFFLIVLVIPVLVILGAISLIGLSIISDTVTNNLALSEYESRFEKLIHPQHSSQIHSFAYVSPPSGSGGQCFYFLGELRQYSGSETDIVSFYDDKNVFLDFATDGKFSRQVPYGLDDLTQWPIEYVKLLDQNIYIVYWLVPDYFPPYGKPNMDDIDLRCS